MEAKLATTGLDDKKTGKLAAFVHMAIGMKAMVLLNLATEADIANGTWGQIHDIVLDERERLSVPDEDGVIRLKYPPAMILFKPDKKTKLTFEGLPPGVIPITTCNCYPQVFIIVLGLPYMINVYGTNPTSQKTV